MDETQLASLITILSALPGLCLGLAMLMGRWKPASLSAARDPDGARIATGIYCVLVSGMVILLGISLSQLPSIGPYAAVTVVAFSLLGLIPLLRATRT
jgi:hypothetical protein